MFGCWQVSDDDDGGLQLDDDSDSCAGFAARAKVSAATPFGSMSFHVSCFSAVKVAASF
jgi:hypothetical protein